MGDGERIGDFLFPADRAGMYRDTRGTEVGNAFFGTKLAKSVVERVMRDEVFYFLSKVD